MLDEVDQVLVDALSSAAELALGPYVVNEMKNTLDRLPGSLLESTSPLDVIRLFKRANRGLTRPLVVQNPDRTPEDEAHDLWSRVYAADTFADPEPVWEDSAFDLSKPTVRLFSPLFVSLAIRRYPSARSCGEDGLHIRLLSALCQPPPSCAHPKTYASPLADTSAAFSASAPQLR